MKLVVAKLIEENTIKNLGVIVLGIILFPFIKPMFSTVPVEQLSDLLLILSILLVTACFANFAFSYEHSDLKCLTTKIVAHSATAIFMFLIFIILEMIVIISSFMYPTLYGLLLIGSILLYIGCVLYDFWDLLRIQKK